MRPNVHCFSLSARCHHTHTHTRAQTHRSHKAALDLEASLQTLMIRQQYRRVHARRRTRSSKRRQSFGPAPRTISRLSRFCLSGLQSSRSSLKFVLFVSGAEGHPQVDPLAVAPQHKQREAAIHKNRLLCCSINNSKRPIRVTNVLMVAAVSEKSVYACEHACGGGRAQHVAACFRQVGVMDVSGVGASHLSGRRGDLVAAF